MAAGGSRRDFVTVAAAGNDLHFGRSFIVGPWRAGQNPRLPIQLQPIRCLAQPRLILFPFPVLSSRFCVAVLRIAERPQHLELRAKRLSDHRHRLPRSKDVRVRNSTKSFRHGFLKRTSPAATSAIAASVKSCSQILQSAVAQIRLQIDEAWP